MNYELGDFQGGRLMREWWYACM